MKGLILFLIASATIALCPSCKDKTGPCEGVVTVTDSLGNRVSGASVTLRPDSSVYTTVPPRPVDPSITQTGTTDASGNAFFTYKLEAVLIIDAAKGAKTGKDYIRLEQGKTVTKTVIIR
jgi:hypothetical protein